ncbi:hypothetical protein P3339_07195 [Microbulbifer sp. MLAF003]|uniref:hypothetical protein n=1 Tax=unclassified Microbulbifer TaxID=2619833 RepID=UPI0024ADCA29|nr:hypothetical protein [Microbulbifer sp. MLAF003]WHI52543.1 hypothetical protein P3339_07195 [Microbulbifer sp. MLAF003]
MATKAAQCICGLGSLFICCTALAQSKLQYPLSQELNASSVPIEFQNLPVPYTPSLPRVSTQNGWRFAVTPYLFLPLRTKGESTVAGTTVDVDLNLKRTLELLNVAFSARLEAWKGRFGVVTDLYYVHLNLKEGASIRPPRNPQLDIDINIDVNVDVHQGWVAAFGAFRLLDGSFATGEHRYFWDVGAGVRWNRLRQEVKARVGIDIAPMPEVRNRLGGRKSWWEPAIGTRVGLRLNDCLTLGARTEIGGFGASGDELQWNLLVGLDWRAWEATSLRLGYQYYSIDYSSRLPDGKFAYDIDQHGPYIAATWRW